MHVWSCYSKRRPECDGPRKEAHTLREQRVVHLEGVGHQVRQVAHNQALMGGRAGKAQEYTYTLCRAMCRCLRRQKKYDRSGKVSTDPLGRAQLSSLVRQLRQWQDDRIPEVAPSPVFALSSVGALLRELIGGRTISGGKPEVESSGDLDIHELPEHWKDEQHKPTGTAPCHLEVSEAIIESRKIVPDDIVQGPIPFTVGDTSGQKIMIDEMAKLEACRLLSLDIDKWSAWTCYDDVSGDRIDPALVQAARELEIDYLKNLSAYDIVSRKEMKKSGQGKRIKGRCSDVNKGDSVTPDVRSRHAGKDFATGVDASLYAGFLLLEALEMLIGEAASNMLSDVKRAHFHAAARREMYVEIHREDPDWTPDAIGRRNLALYGTRNAAKLWQECVAKHLLSIGFKRR